MNEDNNSNSKCLLCKINYLESLHQAELDKEQKIVNPFFSGVSRRRIRRARYWKNREIDIYYNIISAKDNRSLHSCSFEHRNDMYMLRKAARFTHSQNYKTKFKRVLSAIEAKAQIDLALFKAQSINDESAIASLKAEQLTKKILLGQRSRRLREMTPQLLEDQQVIENFIRRMLERHV